MLGMPGMPGVSGVSTGVSTEDLLRYGKYDEDYWTAQIQDALVADRSVWTVYKRRAAARHQAMSAGYKRMCAVVAKSHAETDSRGGRVVKPVVRRPFATQPGFRAVVARKPLVFESVVDING